MHLNWPNLLTWTRIVLVPVFVVLFYLPDSAVSLTTKNVTAAYLFLFGAITDWLDGYLARSLNQTSAFGAFLDPVADKLLVTATLIVLVELGRVDVAVAVIIIGREIAISALREWMAKIGQSKSVAVSFIGKLKTACQMTALAMLLHWEDLFGVIPLQTAGVLLVYVAALLTLISMVIYLRRAWPLVQQHEAKSP
ncbi:MAG: CDP-diacylglycerol--glycerol-3-phosphate 3-phosphatidyltransferase [Betaproteobacteria bacterium]|nr:CDP-diacylglycerol--glycerol-3-phosphate 3-phosphatidyltransferase [Betaproteobacteria bacterium]MBL8535727.1 CDP-diacylglycerol--glycerol-3-phosphate 3-phosphatidyltransferase [Betaproteobacteria bacterium]